MLSRADQHSIAKREQAEATGNRTTVEIEELLATDEGRDQHHEGGAGDVEIGNEAARDFEFVTWLNEKVGDAPKR